MLDLYGVYDLRREHRLSHDGRCSPLLKYCSGGNSVEATALRCALAPRPSWEIHLCHFVRGYQFRRYSAVVDS